MVPEADQTWDRKRKVWSEKKIKGVKKHNSCPDFKSPEREEWRRWEEVKKDISNNTQGESRAKAATGSKEWGNADVRKGFTNSSNDGR